VSPLKIQRASFRIVENPWKILNKSVALKSWLWCSFLRWGLLKNSQKCTAVYPKNLSLQIFFWYFIFPAINNWLFLGLKIPPVPARSQTYRVSLSYGERSARGPRTLRSRGLC
jgi:hypothetical protein